MKQLLTDAEVRQVRRESEEHMTDVVAHLVPTTTTGTYGEQVKTWSTASTYRAGLAFSPFKFRAREMPDSMSEGVSEVLVRARLPHRSNVSPRDRIVLLTKFGVELAEPMLMEVQGPPELTLAGPILNLKYVEL